MHVHIVFVQNFKKNTTSDHTKKENQTLCGHTSPTYKKENQTLYFFAQLKSGSYLGLFVISYKLHTSVF